MSLADLMSWSVPVQWHEAVAVVRQVAALVTGGGEPTVRAGSPPAASPGLQWPPPAEDIAGIGRVDMTGFVPGPSGVWLTTDGAVQLDPTSAGSKDTVPGLATLLRSLLPATAPVDLLALADAENPNVRDSSGQEFLAALTFFARPDDIAEVQALVARALDLHLASERAAALRTLTERARHAAPEAAAEPASARNPLPYRRLAIITAAVIVAGLAAVGAWRTLARTPTPAAPDAATPSELSSPARRVQEGLASAAALVGEALGVAPEPPRGRGADVQLAAPRRGHGQRGVESTETARPGMEAGSAGAAAVAPEGEAAGGAPPQRALPQADAVHKALATAPHGVYSSASPDVIPPALLRPQMPEVPLGGVPLDGPRGLLELTIDATGEVTSARLVPASNRHQDRMMVSAAKTWRFAPATRNGEAVQYRLQMPITW